MEEYLGTTKYDAKIRRITLKKMIAEYMDMREGDFIDYYKVGEDIIIRKRPREYKDATDINSIIPIGTDLEDVKLILDAADIISKHYMLGQQPDNIEMIKIVAEVMQTYPVGYSEEKKLEMLDMSIRAAKELFSKTSLVIVGKSKRDTDEKIEKYLLKKK